MKDSLCALEKRKVPVCVFSGMRQMHNNKRQCNMLKVFCMIRTPNTFWEHKKYSRCETWMSICNSDMVETNYCSSTLVLQPWYDNLNVFFNLKKAWNCFIGLQRVVKGCISLKTESHVRTDVFSDPNQYISRSCLIVCLCCVVFFHCASLVHVV